MDESRAHKLQILPCKAMSGEVVAITNDTPVTTI